MDKNEARNLKMAWYFLAAVVIALLVIWTWRILSLPAPLETEFPEMPKTWEPAFIEWIGKPAPNFIVSDINGVAQSLDKHKGKNVMLVFWATWCGPCKQEIPSLIELRNEFSPEQFALLAISFEGTDIVKQFAGQQQLNYTVIASGQDSFPAPFNSVDSIPAGFFIDKKGIIRLATLGVVSPQDARSILKSMQDSNSPSK